MSGKPSVYIETSVISYYTSRPSRDIVTAAYQELTRSWWKNSLHSYKPLISEIVIGEIGGGDRTEAKKRLDVIKSFQVLNTTKEVQKLGDLYLSALRIPRQAYLDAYHIAVAVLNGVDYIVSWNFKHITNVIVKSKIESINTKMGYGSPVICTPEELL